MGQKTSKTPCGVCTNSANSAVLIEAILQSSSPSFSSLSSPSASSSSSSSSSCSTSSKSKSKTSHESAISNDSGCDVMDAERLFFDSSVLSIFEHLDKANSSSSTSSTLTPHHRLRMRSASGNRKKREERATSRQPPPKKCLAATATAKQSYRNSLVSSSSSSCSTAAANRGRPVSQCSSSNGCILPTPTQLLCEQLNHILNISAGLVAGEQTPNESTKDATANSTLSKRSNNAAKPKKKKKKTTATTTMMKMSESDFHFNKPESKSKEKSVVGDRDQSETKMMRLMSRSHTFHTEHQCHAMMHDDGIAEEGDEEEEKAEDDEVEELAATDSQSSASSFKLSETSSSSSAPSETLQIENEKQSPLDQNSASLMAKMFAKNSRLFTWSNKNKTSNLHFKNSRSSKLDDKTSAGGDHHQQHYLLSFGGQKLSVEEDRLINLIAAKLMSESIELWKKPFTDDWGFCKIPIGLVKRYAFELKQTSLDMVAKCLETERLSQLEKCGKVVGIPNDFLASACKCLRRNETRSELRWTPCKCDLDFTSLENFFARLGLPYSYFENLLRQNPSMERASSLGDSLFKMSDSDVKLQCQIENEYHLEMLLGAISQAKHAIT